MKKFTLIFSMLFASQFLFANDGCRLTLLEAQGQTVQALKEGRITIEHAESIFDSQNSAMASCLGVASKPQLSVCEQYTADLNEAKSDMESAFENGRIGRVQRDNINLMIVRANDTVSKVCN